jgi:hypothetical protein
MSTTLVKTGATVAAPAIQARAVPAGTVKGEAAPVVRTAVVEATRVAVEAQMVVAVATRVAVGAQMAVAVATLEVAAAR